MSEGSVAMDEPQHIMVLILDDLTQDQLKRIVRSVKETVKDSADICNTGYSVRRHRAEDGGFDISTTVRVGNRWLR